MRSFFFQLYTGIKTNGRRTRYAYPRPESLECRAMLAASPLDSGIGAPGYGSDSPDFSTLLSDPDVSAYLRFGSAIPGEVTNPTT